MSRAPLFAAVAAAALLLLAAPAHAGVGHHPDGEVVDTLVNVTLNPTAVLIGGSALSVTVALGDYVSLSAGLDYTLPLLAPVHQVGGGIDLLFWPKRANNGWFVGPYAHIAESLAAPGYLPITSMHVGAMFGWRWLWASGFNVGLGGGAGYRFEIASASCPSGASCTTVGAGLGLRMVADIGFAF